jgi:hypothetical protein
MKLSIISIHLIWAEDGEVMRIVGLRLHKASKANRFRGKTWEIIKGVSRDNVGEVRNDSRGRRGCILDIGCRIGKCWRG